MRNLIGLLSIALLATQALAADAEVTGIEIVNFGIYTVDVTSREANPGGVAHSAVANPKLAVHTTTIPAQLGLSFGFQYKLLGSPAGAKVDIHRVTRFPKVGLRAPGGSAPRYVSERDLSVAIGEVLYMGYGLTESWEVVPGEWSIEIWHNGRKLADRHFTLVKQ